MDNNNKEPKNSGNGDTATAMIFGIIAVVIMIIAAHFMG